MSKTVFILGAGASAQVGAPVMNNFLGVAETLMRGNRIEGGRAGRNNNAFQKVFKAIDALGRVFEKSVIDLRNVESVFTTFEMAQILGTLKAFEGHGQTNELLEDLKTLIVATLDETVTMTEPGTTEPASVFRQFVII
jgi:hypothetical protein